MPLIPFMPVQIFTIFSAHGMGILQPHPRCERNRRRKNLPARWWSRQESDRSSYRVIDRSKGVILPLDLGAYRFCLHGRWGFDFLSYTEIGLLIKRIKSVKF